MQIGTKMPEIGSVLDWCRYTVNINPNLDEKTNLQAALPAHPAYALTGDALPNAKGYDSALRLTIGTIHWHTEVASQGISVQFTGSDLAVSRYQGLPDDLLLGEIARLGGRISTMDAALDLYGVPGKPRDIIRARDAGRIKTHIRHIGYYETGEYSEGKWQPAGTVYIGSPKGKRQIKIYDKAAEQGINTQWIRLEMRWRASYAQMAHAAMLKYGIANVTQSAIKGMFSSNIRWLSAALTGVPAYIEPVRKKRGDTELWLLRQVLPTLERELERERGSTQRTLYNAFSKLLWKYSPSHINRSSPGEIDK